MALQKTIVTPQGFTSVDAYITCENFRAYKKDRIEFNVRFYKEKGAIDFKDVSYDAPYDIEGTNLFKQAYEYLKTLPEFADAVDC